MNQTLVKESRLEDYTRTIRERDNGERERGREKSRRGERREERRGEKGEDERKTKLSIEAPSVDVGSTIIRIENRSSGAT